MSCSKGNRIRCQDKEEVERMKRFETVLLTLLSIRKTSVLLFAIVTRIIFMMVAFQPTENESFRWHPKYSSHSNMIDASQ